MKKNEVKTFEDVKLNIITLAKNIIPDGMIEYLIMDTPLQLDIEFLSKYKNRFINSFLETIVMQYGIEENGEFIEISGVGQMLIQTLISNRYKEPWKRLYDLYMTKYDALSPFDITLNEDSTDNFITLKDKTTYEDNDSTYAYNSDEDSPTDKSIGGTEHDYSRENPKHREYTRKGNIGNTSRQELVRQEREILKYQLLDTIYDNLANLLLRDSYKYD